MVGKAGLNEDTCSAPMQDVFMGKRHFTLGPKLIHIRNEDVGPNDLPSPLEESSDAQGDWKTVWGALNLSAPRLKSSLRPTSLLCNLRTPSKRLDRQVDSQAFGSETRGVTFSSLIPIIHLWCIKDCEKLALHAVLQNLSHCISSAGSFSKGLSYRYTIITNHNDVACFEHV